MPSGLQISVEYIHGVLWPFLQEELGADAAGRLAIAVIGIGSDVIGLDDDISRDHHWGPRANILLLPGDKATLQPRIRALLADRLPHRYGDFPITTNLAILAGVCCTSIDDFFDYFLGTPDLPARDVDWLRLCETDLFHVTGGRLVIDGPGEMTRRRAHLAYYPDAVWKKRIADWCMYITGRDAPYNLHRLAKREDDFTGAMYKAMYCKQVLELLFTLNRRYAPYTKWLQRLAMQLPAHGGVVALLGEIHREPDLHRCVRRMIDVNYILGDAIASLGIAKKPERIPFDDGLADLTLYGTAAQIYASIPHELFAPSFNRTELWERLARDVLFDSSDYFASRRESGH